MTYQWQSSPSESGTYVNIAGAQAATYTLAPGDFGRYIRVIATGSGSYYGSVTSGYKGPVAGRQITSISDIIGSTKFGQTLTAGTVTPYGATVTYQWQVSDTGSGPNFTWYDLNGATSNTCVVDSQWSYRYYRVEVTGTGLTGIRFEVLAITRAASGTPPRSRIAAISGTAQVGVRRPPSALTQRATAVYQRQRCPTENGAYTSTRSHQQYVPLTSEDAGNYIKVLAMGMGNYVGTVPSPLCPVPYRSPTSGLPGRRRSARCYCRSLVACWSDKP